MFYVLRGYKFQSVLFQKIHKHSPTKHTIGLWIQVHVQSDAAGRLVISGEPEQPDNPWGVTPFRKVTNSFNLIHNSDFAYINPESCVYIYYLPWLQIVTLPSRIDAHQTSAIVTLHGQLFVRAPFEQQE